MTVQELIDALSKLPPDHMVVVNGYEGGVNEISDVVQCKLDLNVNTKWYYGKHETHRRADSDDDVPGVWIGC